MADLSPGPEGRSWEDFATQEWGPGSLLIARAPSKYYSSHHCGPHFLVPGTGLRPGPALSHLTLSTTPRNRTLITVL